MSRGTWKALSPARKMVHEVVHHASKVPSVTVARRLSVTRLLSLRRDADVSWIAVFTKAFSIVAQDVPEFRRAYIPYPWPHYYEHPSSIVSWLIERDVQGEAVVLAARHRDPLGGSLADLDKLLRSFRERPVDEIGSFRMSFRLGRMPAFLRRFLVWQSLYFSGARRAKRFGTFLISSLGNYGLRVLQPLSINPYLLLGPIEDDGTMEVTLQFDHRVLDGRPAARALVALEEALNGPILSELAATAARRRPSRAA